jgi:3-hydroxyacyl-[acyl-carrier-protein] dehydratase
MSTERSETTAPDTAGADAGSRAGRRLPLSIEDICKLLPHRYPFLLLDRITEWVPRERIAAIKCVSGNEPFFAGHFPGHPIMPGVLIIECMAQAGAALIMLEMENPGEKLILFTGIEKARFRRPVVPGDQLSIQVQTITWRTRYGQMDGKALVDGVLAAEAVITCHVVDRPR